MKLNLSARLYLLGSLTSLLLTGCSSSEPELHLYTWSNYIKPDLIERFEQENHCRVVVNTFDSNESMYAKISLGATGYDIIFPSNYFADLMQENGLIQHLDPERLSNYSLIDPIYFEMMGSTISQFAIPYTLTSTAIGYRRDKVEIEEPSWGIFGRQSLKGRMTMLNDPREALGAALKFLGYSLNTTNESEIAQAEKVLVKWKENLAKFESEQYKNGLASAEFLVVQGFAGEILLVSQENQNVLTALPREGTIISIDTITIPTGAPNIDLAYAFINFLLEPTNALETVLYTQFLVANTGAYPLLPERLKASPALFPPKSIAEKSELIKNLGADTELYNQAWDRIKAAE